MTDSPFNNDLDALVRGQSVASTDELTRFATNLYRKEQNLAMPHALKQQIAGNLGVPVAAPISNRTRRAAQKDREHVRRPWPIAFTVAIAAALALTGILQWGMQPDDSDRRFGMLSPAVPTAEATPVATPAADIGWLSPISPDECPNEPDSMTEIPQVGDQPYLGLPERAYGPYTSPASYTRDNVFQRAREVRSCAQVGSFGPDMSSRLVYETYDRDFAISDEAEQYWADQIVQGKKISEFYANQHNVSSANLGLMIPADTERLNGLSPGQYTVVNPDWIVQLADGRVVVLVTSLTVTTAGTVVVDPSEPTAGFGAWVFVQQDGEWLLDEFLPVCFGECEAFWDMRPGANLLRTPVPAECRKSLTFDPDYEVTADAPVNLRPGPGIQSGDAIVAVVPGTPLMYLCESAQSTNLEVDKLYEGQLWLKVRTESGVEGWVREIDVRPVTSATPTAPTVVEIVPMSTFTASPSDGDVQTTPTSTSTAPPQIEPVDLTPTPTD